MDTAVLNELVFAGFVLATFLVIRSAGQGDISTADNDTSTNADTKLCFVQTYYDTRMVSVTSIGEVLPEEAALFQRGRLLRRLSRFRSTGYRGDGHGFGTANVLAALCEVCRKHKKTRCLRRFCSVRRRIRPRSKFTINVVCI